MGIHSFWYMCDSEEKVSYSFSRMLKVLEAGIHRTRHRMTEFVRLEEAYASIGPLSYDVCTELSDTLCKCHNQCGSQVCWFSK